MDFKKDFVVSKEAGSTVKVTGEIPAGELNKHKASAVKTLSANMKVDGFRPGHVPEAVVLKEVGEFAILTEAAERAIAAVYPEILKAHAIDALGHPKIEITKIAIGNPLGFTATVAVMPEIKLPDYQKIAQETNNEKGGAVVSDLEVEEQIKTILRSKAAYERLQKKAAAGEKESHTHADGTVHEGPAHDDHGQPLPDNNDLEIPELTDEVVKTLGMPGQFEDVAGFEAKIREHLEIEKRRETEAKHRAILTDKIVEVSTFELPEILVESEMAQMFGQMEEEIKRAGLSVDDYLNHMKKTRDDLRKEWSPTAEKRARLQLVLNEIAKVEKIEPEKDKLEEETKHLLEQHKNADPIRVRIYVASVLQNEAVMKFLESR
jgi:trigger factor